MEWIELIIKEIRVETQEYVSIIFAKPKGFTFTLGECFSFRFPSGDTSKVFSFASSPSEDVIIISYKKGVSEFKKKLQKLHIGESMEVALYGSQYHFDSKKSSIFIAGGIGITAFRSIIKYCVDKHIISSIHLIFMNRTEYFPFREELENFKRELKNLSVTYIATSIEGRLSEEKIEKLSLRKNDEVYIAGPPLMIDTAVYLLKHYGIKEKYLHTESFDGYTEET